MLSIAFYIFAAVILTCIYSCIKPCKFPPGPKWLPLVGSFPAVQLKKNKHRYFYVAFEELSKIYGPILGLKLGKQKFVVVSSYDLVKKALLKDEFCGRPDGFFFRVRSFGKEKGVVFTEGSIWSQHRKFTLKYLRNFGLGQTVMNEQITMEAQSLISFLTDKSKNGPVEMHTTFDIAVLNSLWVMFAGHRFTYDDVKVKEILTVVHNIFRISDSLGGIMSHMPFLRHIIPETLGFKDLMCDLNKLWSFLGKEIKDHENHLNDLQESRDLIDAFLMEIRNKKNELKEETIFDHENLLILCLDLFLAGIKTTTDTLATIFAFLALNQHWVKELQDEMSQVIGRSRPPQLTDQLSLPKVEAFLAEAQRFLILAPLGIPHKATKDTMLNDYRIPKGTIVLMNLHSAQNDSSYFKEPEKFMPQRFLDSNGKFKSIDAAMPFGAGKRRCLGEIIARSSLFLFFTYVLHYFTIDVSEAHGKPDMTGYDGFTISPKPYYLELKLREDQTDSDAIATK